jgi:hypothetical protein
MAQQPRSQRAIARAAAAAGGEAAAGKATEDTSACGCFTKFQAGLTA